MTWIIDHKVARFSAVMNGVGRINKAAGSDVVRYVGPTEGHETDDEAAMKKLRSLGAKITIKET